MDVQQRDVIQPLLLQELNQQLGIHKDNIRAMYLHGSRVYYHSTHNHDILLRNSDFDLLIVIDHFHTSTCLHHISNSYNSAQKDKIAKVVFAHDMTVSLKVKWGNNNENDLNEYHEFECHIMSTDIFLRFLLKHKPVMTLCFFLPEAFIWLEDDGMRKFKLQFLQYNIQLHKLRINFVREAEIWCYAKSKRLFAEGDKQKALKNLIHGIRYLLFTIQIIEHGKIVNWSAANEHFQTCMSRNYETMEEYCNEFRPIYESLIDEIAGTITRIEQNEISNQSLSLLTYLNRESLHKFSRLNPVAVCHLPPGDLEGMIKFLLDPSYQCLEDDQIRPVDMCNGSIVRFNTSSKAYEWVCLGVLKELNQEQTLNANLDLSIHLDLIYEYTAGDLYHIFYYQGQWHVSCASTTPTELFSLQIHSNCNSISEVERQFWITYQNLEYRLPDVEHHGHMCFSFILSLDTTRLMLHCARNLRTLEEESIEHFACEYSWRCASRILVPNYTSTTELIGYLIQQSDSLDPWETRGFFCRDSRVNDLRIRIDHGFYLYMSKCKIWDVNIAEDDRPFQDIQSQHNVECMLNALRFCSNHPVPSQIMDKYFTLFSGLFTKIQAQYGIICRMINSFYESNNLAQVSNQQEFSKLVEAFPLEQRGPLFLMKKKHATTVEQIMTMMLVRPSGTSAKMKSARNKDFSKLRPVIDTRVLYQIWKQYNKLEASHYENV